MKNGIRRDIFGLVGLFIVPAAILISSCMMDTEKIQYISLSPCLMDAATGNHADSSGRSSITIIKYSKYEVCKDSSKRVAVIIRRPGEHQIQLNGANVTKFNGLSLISILGPFQDENEIRILENGKQDTVVYFLNPT